MIVDAEPGRPYDVAIAGAGPAGGALAVLLASAGVRVVVLDAAAFPRDKLCGEFLSPECWGVLGRLGLERALQGFGFEPIRQVRLTTPRGRVLESPIRDPDGRPGLGLSRATLDTAIAGRAREAGATLIENARVRGPILDARGQRVIGLRVRHATDGPFEVRARVTVAADGRRSALVRRTGETLASGRIRPRLFGMKRHLHLEGSAPDEPPGTVGLHLFPGGYGGTCRIERGLTNLCALLPESSAHRQRGNLDRIAEVELGRNPRLARLRGADADGGWKTIAGVRVERSRPLLDGILYVGDCQGTIDPLGGQGMTMALLGAELLAPFVREALRRGEVDHRLRRDYDSIWHARNDGRIRLCRLFHQVLIHPRLIDLASYWPTMAPRVLAGCFERTRDAANR